MSPRRVNIAEAELFSVKRPGGPEPDLERAIAEGAP